MNQNPKSATVRTVVKLPRMPGEQEARDVYRPFQMERSQVVNEKLVFDSLSGLSRALLDGFFLVRIPQDFEISEGDALAQHFFEERVGDKYDSYRGFRHVLIPGEYQGFFDRPYDQWENLYVGMENWSKVLPEKVAILGDQMTDLGISILKSVLEHLDFPSHEWPMITSGLVNKTGHQMLAFNHFRSSKFVRGAKFHRDSGWVTVLRSVEPGLLGLIEGQLYLIDPVPGFFIVNFGSSIEVLTEDHPRPVRASIHGVVRTERLRPENERWSYLVFLDSNLGGTIYKSAEGKIEPVQSVSDFAIQEVSRTYDDDDSSL